MFYGVEATLLKIPNINVFSIDRDEATLLIHAKNYFTTDIAEAKAPFSKL